MRSRPTASLLFAGSSLAIAACSSSPAPDTTAPVGEVATSASAAPTPVAVEPPGKVALSALLCAGRPQCKIISDTKAGKDASGNALHVVALSLPLSMNDESDSPAEPPSEDENVSRCDPAEHWLVASNEQGFIEQSASLLLNLCKEGYDDTNDQVSVANGVLSYTVTIGSAERWTITHSLQLSSLRLIYSSNSGYLSPGIKLGDEHWDWATFSGTSTWHAAACDKQGAPDWLDESKSRYYEYTPIPQIRIDNAFLTDQWKNASLGSCAARIEPRSVGTYLLDGDEGGKGDAMLRVVASSATELFINVEDDQWQSDNGAIDKQDHVQLWLTSQSINYSTYCVGLKTIAKPKAYLVRMSDGKVFPGANTKSKDAKPKVELSRSERGVHLKVTLPQDTKGLTVAYADSDTKGKIERVIATSPLKTSDPATLGYLNPIRVEAARCVVSGGELVVQQVPITPSRKKPALP